MADLGYAFGLEPAEAVKYFEGLGFNVPSDWRVTWSEAQAKARAIAGIHKQDIAAQIHGALYASMKNGTSFETFRDDVTSRLKKHDWQLLKDGDIVNAATGEVDGKGITRHRLETIYRTQMQSAYMAGHWQTFEEGRDFAPWLQYSAILDSRTRQSHRAAHGAVYHIDDPFWDYFYPPNGFNCRCTVKALSDRDLAKKDIRPRKSDLEDVELVVNKKGDTVSTKAVKLPDGQRFYADNGFQHNVGKHHLANLGQLQMQRAAELPPKLASVATHAAMAQPEWKAAVSRKVAAMVERVNAEKVARGEMLLVGALSMPVLDILAMKNIYPQSAVIAMSDERVLHGLRDIKHKPLPLEFWQTLPDKLQEPEAILLGVAGRNGDGNQFLLFVYPAEDQKKKLVVTLDYKAKSKHPHTGKKERFGINMINTGNYAEEGDIYKNKQYELLWKK